MIPVEMKLKADDGTKNSEPHNEYSENDELSRRTT